MSLDTRRSYNTVTHSRTPSQDSRVSDSSRTSTETRYSTSTTMANGRVEYLRVPDNESHYVKSTTSHSGRVKVIDQRSAIFDPDAPRASEARYEDYKRSQERSGNRHRDQARQR